MFGGEKLGGAKVFDFRLATVFSLGYRHSKHKITRHSKYLGGMTPCPPLRYTYVWKRRTGQRSFLICNLWLKTRHSDLKKLDTLHFGMLERTSLLTVSKSCKIVSQPKTQILMVSKKSWCNMFRN